MKEKELKFLRSEIDNIDDQLLELIVKRTSIVDQIGILKKGSSKEWQISYHECIFNLRLTKFKHIGIFPEQRINWDFIKKRIKKNDKLLNLFAHTGGASLVAKANAGSL